MLFPLGLQAQQYHIGGKAAGLSNAAVTISDLWAVHHNQAALAHLEKAEGGVYYENRFLVSALGLRGGAFALPTANGVFGLSVSAFGFDQYRENKYGLAYAMKLSSNLSVGIQMDYFRTVFSEPYGRKGFFAGEIGFLMRVTESLKVGAHLFNPGRTRIDDFADERLPSILRFGAQYSFSEQVTFYGETEKDIDRPPVFRGGLEYHPNEPLYLRIGAGSQPFSWTFGFGYQLKGFSIDLASSFHPVLGYSPQASLHYQFQ